VLDRLGLDQIRLELNSIGCPECRARYNQALREYFGQYKDRLCDTCLSRLEMNPMRLLDCKSPQDQELAKDAPKITDYLCEECENHFSEVKRYLDSASVEYTVNPKIVRGLDYYTKTVFEFVTDCIGAQGTVCGGGRYDGLIEELGGKHMPSLGFAMGLERLLMVMDAQGITIPDDDKCALYIATMGDDAKVKAFELLRRVRECGLIAETDVVGRGLRAQMKYADKIGAKYSLVLGDNELSDNKAKVKNMETGEQTELALDESFAEKFSVLNLTDNSSFSI
jgi:histidyl-tRNA synthetase